MSELSMLDHALRLAEQGFHVFPLGVNSKLPAVKDYPNVATTDPDQIKRWWMDPVLEVPRPYNIGISTTRFGKRHSLLAIDVDNKGEKNGDKELKRLESEGWEFPETYMQVTPTGGRHIIYMTEEPLGQGVNVLAKGIDTRGRGGYVVGAGSQINGLSYKARQSIIAKCPKRLVDFVGVAPVKHPLASQTLPNIDRDAAIELARSYLRTEAPFSIEGNGGDSVAYLVAARIKDFGCAPSDCLKLMLDGWNDHNEPPWSADELKAKVDHAYRYGRNPIGINNKDNHFDPIEPDEILSPIEKINKEYAFVMTGGSHHILWETTDSDGKFKLDHISELSFHKKFASQVLQLGDNKTRPLTEAWLRSPLRRSYDGICFEPGKQMPERFYNLWRGFTVEPAPAGERHKSLDMLLEHALKNVCQGNEDHFKWLISFFAHLVQKPWEKPLVALVFKGSKGVGKNALVESIGSLLGHHFLLTAKKRYLTGNFNSHLQNCVMLALDEAFWSGDKEAEGVLKDLITGRQHVIELKGKEPYAVKNCTRVCIIGNEDWVVPASEDERRFAVFEVGEGRKRDTHFFQAMREGFESGGLRVLLRYLLDFDISNFNINEAPKTTALLEQKLASADPFHQWWYQCLNDGYISHYETGENLWIQDVVKERLRNAYKHHARDRNIKSRMPDERAIGRLLRSVVPRMDPTQKKREGASLFNIYRFPPLDKCRESFDEFIGHACPWPQDTR